MGLRIMTEDIEAGKGWAKANKIDFYKEATKNKLRFYKGINDFVIAMYNYKLWTLEPVKGEGYSLNSVGYIKNLYFLPKMDEITNLNSSLQSVKVALEG